MSKMILKTSRTTHGFTLVEVMVSMAIIVIVSLMVVTGFTLASNMQIKDTDNRNADTSAEQKIASSQDPDVQDFGDLSLPGGYDIPIDKNETGNFNYIAGDYNTIGQPLEIEGKGLLESWAEYKVIATGKYKLEVWGAKGADTILSASGGLGGYSVGVVTLTKGDVLYLRAGGIGTSVTGGPSASGGYNGGGAIEKSQVSYTSGSGGGASDIRIGSESLYSRVIVAGGGGGAADGTFTGYCIPGVGGGNNGTDARQGYGQGKGGTQIAGGIKYITTGQSGEHTAGTFGQGGSAKYTNNAIIGGGGGGWYGGSGGQQSAGGGGSGWIYTASSYATWLAGNSADATQYTLNSDYYLFNFESTVVRTVVGNQSMPDPNSYDSDTGTYTSYMNGNAGEGFVRITWAGR